MLKIIQLICSPIKSLWNHFWQSVLPIFLSFRGYGRLILKKYYVFTTIQFILIVLFFFKPCKKIRNASEIPSEIPEMSPISEKSEMHQKCITNTYFLPPCTPPLD